MSYDDGFDVVKRQAVEIFKGGYLLPQVVIYCKGGYLL